MTTVQYCEQLGGNGSFQLWNALTNLGFLLAAYFGYRRLREQRASGPTLDIACLLGFTVAIGLGSFAWHASSAAAAELADVLPILCFVFLFLASAMRRLLGCRVPAIAAAVVGLAVSMFASAVVGGHNALNGSLAYAPVLAALGALAYACRSTNPAAAADLFGTAGVFLVSLILRTLDMRVCGSLPIGSHWAWHLLNAVVILRATTLLVRLQQAEEPVHRAAP